MRIFSASAVVSVLLLFPPLAPLSEAQVTTPVVVELFTSEGCSSCPPADALLLQLEQAGSAGGADIIALGEHVDYWNGLGWHDRFSAHDFTRRQGQYAFQFSLNSVYTPQMVVDGRFELVGNDSALAMQRIAHAAARSKPAEVSLLWKPDKPSSPAHKGGAAVNKDDQNVAAALAIEVRNAGPGRPHIFLAVTESGLSTSVKGGENGGRVLRHAAVVRRFVDLGQAGDGSFNTDARIAPDPDWKRQNLRVIVLVQKSDGGEVLGAAAVNYR